MFRIISRIILYACAVFLGIFMLMEVKPNDDYLLKTDLLDENQGYTRLPIPMPIPVPKEYNKEIEIWRYDGEDGWYYRSDGPDAYLDENGNIMTVVPMPNPVPYEYGRKWIPSDNSPDDSSIE